MEEKTVKEKSLWHRVGMIVNTAGFYKGAVVLFSILHQKSHLLCCELVWNTSNPGTL